MDPDISGGDAPDMIHLGSTSGRVIWERWRGCFALLNVVANVSQGKRPWFRVLGDVN